MKRIARDFASRPEPERRWLTENSWCDVCEQADLGLLEPTEFEEDGAVIVEGKCARCQRLVRSTVTEKNVTA